MGGGTKKIRYLSLLCAAVIILFTIKWIQNDGYYNDNDDSSSSSLSSMIARGRTAVDNDEHWSPVLVMVFYEALCPDSKFFIIDQLVHVYKTAPILIDYELIPYGKAKTQFNPDGTYQFDCQHGQIECLANIYHSCTIENVHDKELQLDMIACMIKDNRMPKQSFDRCADQFKVQTRMQIHKCSNSSHGRELLKINGDMTSALRPKVTFIPTITLNGSQAKQSAILKNLLKEVCKITEENSVPRNICNF